MMPDTLREKITKAYNLYDGQLQRERVYWLRGQPFPKVIEGLCPVVICADQARLTPWGRCNILTHNGRTCYFHMHVPAQDYDYD